MLLTSTPLDPSTRGFSPPDPLFSITAALFRSKIPPHIRATLNRVPAYYDRNRQYRDTTNLHPEHPANDPPPPKYKSQKLPPPPPASACSKHKHGPPLVRSWHN